MSVSDFLFNSATKRQVNRSNTPEINQKTQMKMKLQNRNQKYSEVPSKPRGPNKQ